MGFLIYITIVIIIICAVFYRLNAIQDLQEEMKTELNKMAVLLEEIKNK